MTWLLCRLGGSAGGLGLKAWSRLCSEDGPAWCSLGFEWIGIASAPGSCMSIWKT